MKPKKKNFSHTITAHIRLLEKLPKVKKLQVFGVLFFFSVFTGVAISQGMRSWQNQQLERYTQSVHAQEAASLDALLANTDGIEYQVVVE